MNGHAVLKGAVSSPDANISGTTCPVYIKLKEKTMKKVLLAAAMVLGITSFASAEVTGVTKVTKVMTYPGVAVIKIGADANGCTFSNKKYLILDISTTNGRAVYSAALTAFTTGSKVQVAHSGCRSWWGATLPKAYRIDLVK
jgi:hypothetical protein